MMQPRGKGVGTVQGQQPYLSHVPFTVVIKTVLVTLCKVLVPTVIVKKRTGQEEHYWENKDNKRAAYKLIKTGSKSAHYL